MAPRSTADSTFRSRRTCRSISRSWRRRRDRDSRARRLRCQPTMSRPVLIAVLFAVVAAPLAAQENAATDDDQDAPAAAAASSPSSASSSSFQVVQLPPKGPAPTPRHTGIMAMTRGLWVDVTNLPSRQNLFWVGVGAAGAAAVHPADTSVTSY